MPESFGARVRRHREDRNVPLRTVSDQTKIKQSLLEGLERDDLAQWPSGIFRRAYVRAYALAIGLDPDAIVREFLLAHPDPPEVIETAPAPSPRFRGLVGSAMESLSRLRRGGAAAPEPPREPLNPPEFGRRSESAVQPQGTAGYVPVRAPQPPPASSVASAPVAPSAPAPPVAAPEPIAPPQVSSSIPPAVDIDLVAAAELCTELGRVDQSTQLGSLVQEVAKTLDAIGLIVWVWDPIASELLPALVHGYSENVLAQLPAVKRDDDNVTAAAFRTGAACAIGGRPGSSDALALPLLTPAGPAGTLALELPSGRAHVPVVRAVATFFAAMLAQLVGGAAPSDAQPERPSASTQAEPTSASVPVERRSASAQAG